MPLRSDWEVLVDSNVLARCVQTLNLLENYILQKIQKLEHVAMFHFQALTNKFFEYSAVIQFASPM